MTKYEELCDAQTGAMRALRDYRRECADFFAGFRKGLADYLECPPEKLRVFPPGEHDKEKDYRIDESLRAGNDGFWNVGLSLEMAPRKLVDIPFRLRKLEGVYTLIVDSEPATRYEFRAAPFDFQKCYADLFERIRSFYEESLDRYLHGKDRRPIGFSLGKSARSRH